MHNACYQFVEEMVDKIMHALLQHCAPSMYISLMGDDQYYITFSAEKWNWGLSICCIPNIIALLQNLNFLTNNVNNCSYKHCFINLTHISFEFFILVHTLYG